MAFKQIVVVDPEGTLARVLRPAMSSGQLSATRVVRNLKEADTLLAGKGFQSALIAPGTLGPSLVAWLRALRKPGGSEALGTAALVMLDKPTGEAVRVLLDSGADQLAGLPVSTAAFARKMQELKSAQDARRAALLDARKAAVRNQEPASSGKADAPLGRQGNGAAPAASEEDGAWDI